MRTHLEGKKMRKSEIYFFTIINIKNKDKKNEYDIINKK